MRTITVTVRTVKYTPNPVNWEPRDVQFLQLSPSGNLHVFTPDGTSLIIRPLITIDFRGGQQDAIGISYIFSLGQNEAKDLVRVILPHPKVAFQPWHYLSTYETQLHGRNLTRPIEEIEREYERLMQELILQICKVLNEYQS